MDYKVYVLYNHKDHKLYVGQTNNLNKRLKLHFGGLILATKNRLPLELIHQENFSSRSEAMKREKFLKSLWGAREKKKILINFLNLKKRS
jgi:putative endonuclease